MENTQQTTVNNTMPTVAKANRRRIWIAILFAVCLPLILWYELENYHMHSQSGDLTVLLSVIGMAFNARMLFVNIRAAVEKEKLYVSWAVILCAVLSMVVCVGVYIIAEKIPHCVECDHITAEELGFLSRWIKGIDVP